jgi:hypothetical protein
MLDHPHSSLPLQDWGYGGIPHFPYVLIFFLPLSSHFTPQDSTIAAPIKPISEVIFILFLILPPHFHNSLSFSSTSHYLFTAPHLSSSTFFSLLPLLSAHTSVCFPMCRTCMVHLTPYLTSTASTSPFTTLQLSLPLPTFLSPSFFPCSDLLPFLPSLSLHPSPFFSPSFPSLFPFIFSSPVFLSLPHRTSFT